MTPRPLGFLLVSALAGLAITASVTTRAQGPGRGGFGPMGGPDQELLSKFDRDGNKRLDARERDAAREFLGTQDAGRGGFGRGQMPAQAQPGPKVAKASVTPVPATVPLYHLDTVRTYFLDFENANWEKELMAFKQTDIEVPATLTVDGKVYRNVGTQFRGASSFMMVPEGLKHSLNITVDAWEKDQNLLGFRSLNLLNNNGDPSHLRAVLYLMVARDYGPAAQANLAKVVLDGESWGIYANVEQVNKDFIRTWYKTDGGARWKVPGSPGGRGGLEYFGEDPAAYKGTFEIKTKDDPASWNALIRLTRTLNETPAASLESALRPMLNIDGVLRFLAIDNTLVNTDGYWTRASDYNLYLDPKGVFHVIPHDANETFGPGGGGRGGPGGFGRGFGGGFPPPPPPGAGDVFRQGGPGAPGGARGGQFRGGGPGGPGGGRGFMMEGDATLDLLIGLTDDTKPLRSKLLAVPALRAKYLQYCREIATKWLDWNRLGPVATKAQSLIAQDVRSDTRKLSTNEAFDASLQQLKTFVEERRAYVLKYQPPAQ